MKASQFSDVQKALLLKQGADGIPVAESYRKAGISQATYFNWEKKYDGLLPTEKLFFGSTMRGRRSAPGPTTT
jgi:putative transposase